MCPCVAARASSVSGSGSGSIPNPLSITRKLLTRSGIFWLDDGGDPTAGRKVQPGMKLDMGVGDSILFPEGTTLVNITGTAIGTLSEGTWTCSGAGTILDITTDAEWFPIVEGSGKTVYSVLCTESVATLSSESLWGYQTTHPNYCNQYGYITGSGGEVVPKRLLCEGFANGETSGGYLGRVALSARFRQAKCATMPNNQATGISSAVTPGCFVGSQHITLSLWMYLPANGDGFRMGCRNNSTNNFYINIQRGPTTTTMSLAVSNGALSGVTATFVNLDAWGHVAMVFDGALTGDTNRVRLYLNGQYVTGAATTPGVPSSTGALTAPFIIGKISADTGNPVNARVARVRAYGASLSAAQVADDYAGNYQTGLCLSWPMVNGAGSVIRDIAGSDNGTSTIPAATLWANRWDDPLGPYAVNYGYQLYHGAAGYVVCPRRIDGTWQYPNHESYTVGGDTYTWVSDHPAITGGWNGNARTDVCLLDMFPGYDGVHVPNEVSQVYDLLHPESPDVPYGDYRDFSLTYSQLLSMKTDSVDSSIRRVVGCRTITDQTPESIGTDRCLSYRAQQPVPAWAKLLSRYCKTLVE